MSKKPSLSPTRAQILVTVLVKCNVISNKSFFNDKHINLDVQSAKKERTN
jgi:hypothetical protein